jgi:hypothetical protein
VRLRRLPILQTDCLAKTRLSRISIPYPARPGPNVHRYPKHELGFRSIELPRFLETFLKCPATSFTKKTRKNVDLVYKEHNLATQSHGLGFDDKTINENRLVFKELIWDSKDSTYTPIGTTNSEILVINYYTSLSQTNTDRSYATVLDVIGNLGGFASAMLEFIGILYGFYLNKTLRDD